MLSIFKKIFYNKECYNCKTLLKKLLCVRKYVKVDPYKTNSSIIISSLEPTIGEYIDHLTNLITDIEIDEFNANNITENKLKNKRFSMWYTNKDNIIYEDGNNKWIDFLSLAIEIVTIYDKYHSNIEDTKKYWISMKIQPYIINIESIIDGIINNQVKEE